MFLRNATNYYFLEVAENKTLLVGKWKVEIVKWPTGDAMLIHLMFIRIQQIVTTFTHRPLSTWWTVKGLKGTVENQALSLFHGGSLKLTLKGH